MAMTSYPGGKNGTGVYQRIINQMPPHSTYVEAFLGGGAIMRAKRPATVNIGIDADAAVIESWRMVPSQNLTLVHGDAIEWLASNTLPDDPPYVMGSRRQQRHLYRCELEDADHIRLLQVIKQLQCNVIISGYWTEMYSDALQGWRTDHFDVRTRGGTWATEWLWMNYPEPWELHDYRYLGENFRERERIKRKVSRWKSKLSHMDQLEKNAIMAAISELRDTIAESDVAAAPVEVTIGAPIAVSEDVDGEHK
jgi:DNA adenine methylase